MKNKMKISKNMINSSKKGFTLAEVKPSRGRNEVKVESESTETFSFRCEDERCRLMRGAVRYGFTLAEVLITLGVIGIVAAMTIPTLIANNQSQKFRSQFKKTLSTLNQAVKMNVAQYEFDFSSACGYVYYDYHAECYSGKDANPTQHKSFIAIANGNLSGGSLSDIVIYPSTSPSGIINEETSPNTTVTYYNVKTAFNNSPMIDTPSTYVLSDGSYAFLPANVDIGDCTLPNGISLSDALNSNTVSTGLCIGYIDVNGPNLPNTEVNCIDGYTTSYDLNEPCEVDNKSIGDVFPVVFYDGTVAPASNAAQYVLNTSK